MNIQSAELATTMWFWDGNSDIWDTSVLSTIWADIPKKVDLHERSEIKLELKEQQPDINTAGTAVNVAVKVSDEMGSMHSLKDETVNE